jgi:hypothetical protein
LASLPSFGHTITTRNYDGMFPSGIPNKFKNQTLGPSLPNTFSSESPGVSVYSSFESMSATLRPEHWGVHGGVPAANCTGGHGEHPNKKCAGDNVMSQRNYPCDNIIFVFFGSGSSHVNQTGEMVFKQQLWQCMVAQALIIKQNIEQTRSINRFGILVWQLNESKSCAFDMSRAAVCCVCCVCCVCSL